jgi:hypothetical protein
MLLRWIFASDHNAISLMTGKHLMEVYYWKFPVFRCNMGVCIDDDVLFCRIKYKNNVGIVTASYRDVARHSGSWHPSEVFAGDALFNFCKAFGVPYEEVNKEYGGRREKDSLSSKGI